MIKWVAAILLMGMFSFNPVTKTEHLTIGFYNVENLFDTLDNPYANDDDFLPDGKKEWTSDRYWEKIDRIAEVIDAIDGDNPVNLVGLCEIENKAVLEDLTANKRLIDANYSFIHRESPDHRGIDVALLYQYDVFEPLDTNWYQLIHEGEDSSSTREILYVKGLVYNKDTLHVFVNHWPSRVGGQEESEPKRIEASDLLFWTIDSIMRVNIEAEIVVLGDLNDTHENESVERFLVGKEGKDQLWLLTHAISPILEDQTFPGTYNYKNEWDLLDHIMVSRGIVDAKKGIRYKNVEAGIFVEDWMLYTNSEDIQYPNRSYGGTNYYGGYSDHLPVYIKLEVK